MTAATLWVGTYPDPSGALEGVWAVPLGADGALGTPVLAARTPVPSFVLPTPDGRTLFAAGETGPGAVTRFAVVRDAGTPVPRLEQRERVSSGGTSPCHLLLHPGGRALYVANYGSGSVGVVALRPGPDGAAELAGGVAQVFEHSGRGPHPERQEAPHAHSTLLTADGAFLLALDLGTDEVRRYRVRPDGLLDADGVAGRLPAGTGPRHAAWGPGGHLYVVGELDAAVHVLRWDGAALTGVGRHPLTAADGALAAHVAVAGDRVLVSVRGPDELVTLRVAAGGAVLEPSGPPRPTGAWPRHFALVAGRVVVAAQHAGEVRVLADAGGGRASSVAVPAPTCVALATHGHEAPQDLG